MGGGATGPGAPPGPRGVDMAPLDHGSIAVDFLRVAIPAFPVRVASGPEVVVTDVVSAFPLIVPAGFGVQSITSLDCSLGWSDVTLIAINFPPGCAGLVGARIEFALNPVYPAGSDSWFVLDDEYLQVEVSSQGNSGQWRVSAYNEDFFEHKITAYYYYDYVDIAPQSSSGVLVSL